MNRQHFLQLACFGVAVSIHFWLAPSFSRADLIQFSTGGPDITDTNGSLTYNSSTGEFQSVTSPLTLSADALAPLVSPPPFVFFTGGSMTIDLKVNAAGGFVSNGTGVKLTGSIDFDGDGTDDVSGTLLQGHIINFGAAPPSGGSTWTSNGLFVIDGGALTNPIPLSNTGGTDPITSLDPLYYVGELAGFTINAEGPFSGTPGDFTADFSSDGVKDNVDPVVPEPPTVILGLVGGGLMGIRGWRSRRRRFGEPTIPFSQNS